MENLKKLGFGCMRLPMLDSENNKVDMAQFCEMVDTFLAKGFRYFDTAYMYHNYQSETFVKEALVKRYPRESFLLADKLPTMQLKSTDDNKRIFDEQLVKCGVDYFDYYLLHCLNVENYAKVKEFKSMDFVRKMKAEGKIKNLGFSFHDTAEVLEKILLEIGQDIDFVQLQINYLDWESESVQSRKCYEVCQKYHKPVIVMEPVKGGKLVNIPQEGIDLLKNKEADMSVASWAIRFAASLDDVFMVLSGMSTWEQLEDNLSYMEDFKPLTTDEIKLTFEVAKIINDTTAIACTSCNYCKENCPMQIQIPEFFELYNNEKRFGEASGSRKKYQEMLTSHSKASDCIACRSCESHCPQHLTIVDYLATIAKDFE